MKAPKRGKARPTQLITNSMRRTFLSCRRKFWYGYERLLKPKQPYLPFVVGGEFHSALERWYKDDIRNVRRIFKGMRRAMLKYQKMLLPPHLLDKLAVAEGMLSGMLAAYFDRYARDLDKWEVVATEHTFSAPTGAEGWEAGGKLDLLVREKKKLWVVEHKTTGDLSVNYVERLPLDDQIHQYVRGAQHDFGKVEGVVYNVVMKSRLRQKKQESFEQFVRRVQGQYEEDPSKFFYRERLKLPKWSLERFDRELAVCAAEISRARNEGESAFYMNTNQCYGYGVCPYAPLCSTRNPEECMSLYEVGKTPHPELEDED
jgi:hypothetical protein